MNVVQRQFGKLTVKGAGNDAHISVILQDFEEADKMLTKIIDASKAWRDSWVSILNVQLGILTGFDELYNPIVGSSGDGCGHPPVITPQEQVERVSHLKEAYGELKTDLLDEVNMMEGRIIQPAMQAKDYIQPIKKTIKKRDNKRLDYERYQDRVSHAHKKMKRTDRENAALAKSEEELAKATDEFKVADVHLKETLPPIIAAAFSILPHLLAAQIMTQNTLLAQYYTILHNYCQDQGFQSPPPSMDDVICQWEQDFKPIQREVEAINTIARGRAVHAPIQLGDDPKKGSSVTGLGIRNQINARRGSSQQITSGTPSPSVRPELRPNRIPSTSSIPSMAVVATPEYDDSPKPDYDSQPVVPYGTSHSPAGPTRDYFSRDRQASNGGTPSSTLSPGALVVGKKKPPPPPPKRLPSGNAGLFVTAIYTFDGQEAGDLSFCEGDVIKVLKKTQSTDDWWEGELRGQKGKFPANYCQMA